MELDGFNKVLCLSVGVHLQDLWRREQEQEENVCETCALTLTIYCALTLALGCALTPDPKCIQKQRNTWTGMEGSTLVFRKLYMLLASLITNSSGVSAAPVSAT